MPEEKKGSEKSKPIVSEDEIERIIKELEKREEERKKREAEEKREEPEKERKKQPEARQPPVLPPVKPVLAPPPEVPKPPAPPALPPKPKGHPFKAFFKYCFLFIILFVLFYLGLNYASYFLQAKYIYKTEIKGEAPPLSFNLPEIPETGEVNLPDSLIIPKIQVDLPIIWEVEEKDILSQLKNGVVHFKGTALPNQEGKVAIFGHSSAYPWQKGKYDQIFALLDKLTPRDTTLIIYQRKKYIYEIIDKKIIKPEEVEILTSKEASLVLITCWPIGTSLRRLVIQAKQIEKPSEPTPVFLPIAP